jgi:Acetyltransferase (GNAT) domain
VQQSSDWAEAIRDRGPDRPLFLLCERDGLPVAGLPLYLYRSPAGSVLTSVPQPGPMGGVFCRRGLAQAEEDRCYALLLARAVELAREHECLTLTVITNPFRPDLGYYERHLAPDYVLENFTQYVPVATAVAGERIVLPDALRRTNLRRNLDRAARAGFSVGPCASDEDLAAWYQVHAARHRELGARPLDEGLLRRILAVLGPRGRATLILVKHGSEIASGGLYVYHRAVFDAYILSMNGKFADAGPNFANTRASLVEASRGGASIYNWQSSPSRTGGVYRYKQQWGSVEAPYAFVTRRLCDPARLWDIGAEGAREHFAGHYVVPFAAFGDRAAAGRYVK